MEDFTVRLEKEALELKEKIYKLYDFINTDALKELSSTDSDLLIAQVSIMGSYYAILMTRLGRLK